MKQILGFVIALILLSTSGSNPVFAADFDTRAAQMHTVLTKYHSPMIGLEGVMIATAEKYGLDWTLLAAIAGTESSFGRRMPANWSNWPESL